MFASRELGWVTGRTAPRLRNCWSRSRSGEIGNRDHDHAILALLGCGLRRQELAQLKVQDIGLFPWNYVQDWTGSDTIPAKAEAVDRHAPCRGVLLMTFEKRLAINGSGLTSVPSDYPEFLQDLKTRIRAAQVRAALAVDRELILLKDFIHPAAYSFSAHVFTARRRMRISTILRKG